MNLKAKSITDLRNIAENIIRFAQNIKIWIFEGEMGAGKTTLIKEIAKQMQVMDAVQSPTYSLVNEYETNLGETIYHFDFYRIQNENEAMDIGYEEYFFSGYYCMIEWASKVRNLIPVPFVKIHIIEEGNNTRNIELSKHYG